MINHSNSSDNYTELFFLKIMLIYTDLYPTYIVLDSLRFRTSCIVITSVGSECLSSVRGSRTILITGNSREAKDFYRLKHYTLVCYSTSRECDFLFIIVMVRVKILNCQNLEKVFLQEKSVGIVENFIRPVHNNQGETSTLSILSVSSPVTPRSSLSVY